MAAKGAKLTEKQRRFVEAFTGVSRGNATDAARRAGYRGSDATLRAIGAENLTKPNIAAAINEANREVRSEALMSRRQCQEWLVRVIQGEECRQEAMTAEGPVRDADGNILSVPPPPKDRLRAMELYGKMRRYLVERRENTGKNGQPLFPRPAPPLDLSRLSDKDLREYDRITALAEPAGD